PAPTGPHRSFLGPGPAALLGPGRAATVGPGGAATVGPHRFIVDRPRRRPSACAQRSPDPAAERYLAGDLARAAPTDPLGALVRGAEPLDAGADRHRSARA